MTQKFSQSLFRIQTRSQRHSEGPHLRPRRLTKALQPSSQGPMGACQPHRAPDGVQAEGWCVYARDAQQGPWTESGQGFKNVFIQTWMSIFIHFSWRVTGVNHI
jgi:hypothetical protein